MRRSVLLILMVVTAACGRDSADVRFAEGPAGEAVPGSVVSALPTPSETDSAEPTPSTPAVAEPVAPKPSAPDSTPMPTSSPHGPREIGQDEDAEVGRSYRFHLYTHCGIETQWFDGRWWNALPPHSEDRANPPPGWGNPDQPGVIVLVTENRLEFTGAQGQRADFVPRPADQEAPPPCA